MERIRRFLKSPEPVKWLFYGDSITHGALHTFGGRDYTELFAERVRFELGRTMDVVLNTAISGNTTRPLLEGFDWRVTQFNPDVVLLMIGMNDCSANNEVTLEAFSANLRELVDRIGALDSETVLQTTCPILPGSSQDREPHFDAYMDAIRNLARERDLPLIDHTEHWRRHSDKHDYWMSNAFHPNHHGHCAFARLLYDALDIYDPESHCCRLYYP